MKKIQPPTILHLVLLGFLVVLLPLIAGMVRSFESLGKMARQYDKDTSRIVHYTEESQTLQRSLVDLERAARQYNVIGDRSYLQVFNDRFEELQKSLGVFSQGAEEKLSPLADLMITEADKLQEKMNELKFQTPEFDKELARFERLFFLSQTLRQEVSAFNSSRVKFAKASAAGVSTELMVYTLTLIPLTLILVSFFTVQILKPLRQIDRTIRRLGG